MSAEQDSAAQGSFLESTLGSSPALIASPVPTARDAAAETPVGLPPPLPVLPPPPPFPPPPEDPAWHDFAVFAGKNAPEFQESWAKLSKGERFSAFCWPAFFFAFVWFLYRKMYGFGAALLLAPTSIVLLFPHIQLGRPVGIGVGVFCAFTGHRLYIAHAKNVIAEIRADARDESEALRRISDAGGVSRPAAIIGAVLTLLLIAVPFAKFLSH